MLITEFGIKNKYSNLVLNIFGSTKLLLWNSQKLKQFV